MDPGKEDRVSLANQGWTGIGTQYVLDKISGYYKYLTFLISVSSEKFKLPSNSKDVLGQCTNFQSFEFDSIIIHSYKWT